MPSRESRTHVLKCLARTLEEKQELEILDGIPDKSCTKYKMKTSAEKTN